MQLVNFEKIKSNPNATLDEMLYPKYEHGTHQYQSTSTSRSLYKHHWGIFNNHVDVLLAKIDDPAEFWRQLNIDNFLVLSRTGRKYSRLHRIQQIKKNVVNGIFYPLAPEARDIFDFFEENKVVKISPSEIPSKILNYYLMQLKDQITTDTVIVDLGSGWGRYSMMIANHYPKNKVLAAEITSQGRKLTEKMAHKYALNIETVEFDYNNWDRLLNKLRTIKTNNILIFSNHSIEQVTLLNLRMFEQILSLDAKVKGVHVEPVGWQLIDGWGFCYNIEPQGARQYYNRNFLLILEHLHKRKLITEPTIIPNFFGIHALENMGTLVKYSSH